MKLLWTAYRSRKATATLLSVTFIVSIDLTLASNAVDLDGPTAPITEGAQSHQNFYLSAFGNGHEEPFPKHYASKWPFLKQGNGNFDELYNDTKRILLFKNGHILKNNLKKSYHLASTATRSDIESSHLERKTRKWESKNQNAPKVLQERIKRSAGTLLKTTGVNPSKNAQITSMEASNDSRRKVNIRDLSPQNGEPGDLEVADQTHSLSYASPPGLIGSLGNTFGGLGGISGLGNGLGLDFGSILGNGLAGKPSSFLPDITLPLLGQSSLLPYSPSPGRTGGLALGGGNLGGLSSVSLPNFPTKGFGTGLNLGSFGHTNNFKPPEIPSVSTVLKEGANAFIPVESKSSNNNFDVLRQFASNPYQSAFRATVNYPSLSPPPFSKEDKLKQLEEEVERDLELSERQLTPQQQTTKAIYESIEGILREPHVTTTSQGLNGIHDPTIKPFEQTTAFNVKTTQNHHDSFQESSDRPTVGSLNYIAGGDLQEKIPSPPALITTPSSNSDHEHKLGHNFVTKGDFPTNSDPRLTPFVPKENDVPDVTSAIRPANVADNQSTLKHNKISAAKPVTVIPSPESINNGHRDTLEHSFVSKDGFPIDLYSRLTPFVPKGQELPYATTTLPPILIGADGKSTLNLPKISATEPVTVIPPPEIINSHKSDNRDLNVKNDFKSEKLDRYPFTLANINQETSLQSIVDESYDIFSRTPESPVDHDEIFRSEAPIRFEARPVPLGRPHLRHPLQGARPHANKGRPPPFGIPENAGAKIREPVRTPHSRRPNPVTKAFQRNRLREEIALPRHRNRPSSNLPSLQEDIQPFLHPLGTSNLRRLNPNNDGPDSYPATPSFNKPTSTEKSLSSTHDPVLGLHMGNKFPNGHYQAPEKILTHHIETEPSDDVGIKLKTLPSPPLYVKHLDLQSKVSSTSTKSPLNKASDILVDFGLKPLPPTPKLEVPTLLSTDEILSFIERQNPNPKPRIDSHIVPSTTDETTIHPENVISRATASERQHFTPLLQGSTERTVHNINENDNWSPSKDESTGSRKLIFDKNSKKFSTINTDLTYDYEQDIEGQILVPSPTSFLKFPGIQTTNEIDSIQSTQASRSALIDIYDYQIEESEADNGKEITKKLTKDVISEEIDKNEDFKFNSDNIGQIELPPIHETTYLNFTHEVPNWPNPDPEASKEYISPIRNISESNTYILPELQFSTQTAQISSPLKVDTLSSTLSSITPSSTYTSEKREEAIMYPRIRVSLSFDETEYDTLHEPGIKVTPKGHTGIYPGLHDTVDEISQGQQELPSGVTSESSISRNSPIFTTEHNSPNQEQQQNEHIEIAKAKKEGHTLFRESVESITIKPRQEESSYSGSEYNDKVMENEKVTLHEGSNSNLFNFPPTGHLNKLSRYGSPMYPPANRANHDGVANSPLPAGHIPPEISPHHRIRTSNLQVPSQRLPHRQIRPPHIGKPSPNHRHPSLDHQLPTQSRNRKGAQEIPEHPERLSLPQRTKTMQNPITFQSGGAKIYVTPSSVTLAVRDATSAKVLFRDNQQSSSSTSSTVSLLPKKATAYSLSTTPAPYLLPPGRIKEQSLYILQDQSPLTELILKNNNTSRHTALATSLETPPTITLSEKLKSVHVTSDPVSDTLSSTVSSTDITDIPVVDQKYARIIHIITNDHATEVPLERNLFIDANTTLLDAASISSASVTSGNTDSSHSSIQSLYLPSFTTNSPKMHSGKVHYPSTTPGSLHTQLTVSIMHKDEVPQSDNIFPPGSSSASVTHYASPSTTVFDSYSTPVSTPTQVVPSVLHDDEMPLSRYDDTLSTHSPFHLPISTPTSTFGNQISNPPSSSTSENLISPPTAIESSKEFSLETAQSPSLSKGTTLSYSYSPLSETSDSKIIFPAKPIFSETIISLPEHIPTATKKPDSSIITAHITDSPDDLTPLQTFAINNSSLPESSETHQIASPEVPSFTSNSFPGVSSLLESPSRPIFTRTSFPLANSSSTKSPVNSVSFTVKSSVPTSREFRYTTALAPKVTSSYATTVSSGTNSYTNQNETSKDESFWIVNETSQPFNPSPMATNLYTKSTSLTPSVTELTATTSVKTEVWSPISKEFTISPNSESPSSLSLTINRTLSGEPTHILKATHQPRVHEIFGFPSPIGRHRNKTFDFSRQPGRRGSANTSNNSPAIQPTNNSANIRRRISAPSSQDRRFSVRVAGFRRQDPRRNEKSYPSQL
ncbi:hypothetical protein SK128_016528 [Halocaridina rubra]|uniref:Uncharacterized protein n=1 Tax=Halocaridina rubra TaxID=373956 RepID=A0AAN8XCH3_HALRR